MKRPAKPSKFRNVKTVVDGVSFMSAREARRFSELKLLERAGQIANLKLQPRYPLVVNGKKVCTYVGDFSFDERGKGGDWTPVVEDAKGYRTREYINKANLFEALFGFAIREV